MIVDPVRRILMQDDLINQMIGGEDHPRHLGSRTGTGRTTWSLSQTGIGTGKTTWVRESEKDRDRYDNSFWESPRRRDR